MESSTRRWSGQALTPVVTLVIVNQANQPASAYASIFQAAKLDSKAYVPESASLSVSQWPTLGSLIDQGKQLVVFLNSQADFGAAPYLIDEFSNVWEDAYGGWFVCYI